MNSFMHLINKQCSRESTPPLDKDDSIDSWHSTISSLESTGNGGHESCRGIPINLRGSYAQRSLRGTPGSPFEVASSPRDRYPNFVSYFREVIEARNAHSYHQPNYLNPPDYRRQRCDGERYQTASSIYNTAKQEHRHFLSPLYNDVMDDICENSYSKADRYGEISNTKINQITQKKRYDNKSFAQKLSDSVNAREPHSYHDRRGSGSSSSSGGHRNKHHSIQELIRTFSKRVGWRQEGSERRNSERGPVLTEHVATGTEEFRSRSKSLDGEHLHRLSARPVLEDCEATYQIFETILKEGANLRRAASQEAEKRRSSLGNVPVARHRASDAFLDPHHAAILFRDSRGLPVADPFLEKVNLSDLANPN